MSEDQSQDRTERATPKRLRDAKRRSQVPRSRELNTALMLLAGALALYLLGPMLGSGLTGAMTRNLVLETADLADPMGMLHRLWGVGLEVLLLFVPFMAVVVATALSAPALLGGWALSKEGVTPKFERLNPAKGLARIFSLRGLVELVKGMLKLGVVGGVGSAFLWAYRGEILAAPGAALAQDLARSFELFGTLFLVLAGATFLIAALDVPYQLWEHHKGLRMTRQEVRDELKETEGRPEVRARIRQLQREASRRRMMDEVPKADLVVTNPTHYAVALRYEPLKAGAPRVVAKGSDFLAGQIRTIAQVHGVPMVEAPPLARALYHGVELGREIPAALYLAVAQLLAYVSQLRTARASGAREPSPPMDLPVPDELLEPQRR